MKGLEPYPWPALDYSLQSVDQRRALLREYLATDSRFNNPWLKDYDNDGVKNWRDLLAKTERVNLLEDTNGDGKADKATVFAEGFNTEVTGTAGGVLWHNNYVYFTVIPDLWLLKDSDNDGKADEKQVLITGHGVHIGQGGHDLHGLTLGPDGRIYWTVGDKGINITSREGKQFFYPNQGVLMRSEPDGSNFEVFAHGLRNCQEITFDDFGNLFCVDNDGDFRGERERLVYVTQGSDTGWRINWQFNHTNDWAKSQHMPAYNPWMEEQLFVPHFEGQAAYITPALMNYSDGPAGFIRNPGTALSEDYANHYFLTQFPGQLLTAFQLRPKDASFEMVDEHTFHDGFMAVGMSFSPKGALYVADWAGQWTPTEEGAIVRIDVPRENRHPMRARTEELINAGMNNRPIAELLSLLNYPDQRVRQQAQFELVNRNEAGPLEEMAFDTEAPVLARVHSIWGLGQLARKNSLVLDRSIDPLLNDGESQVQIQAARLVLEAPILFGDMQQHLVNLLEALDPHVQFHAAMALGAVGDTDAIPSLVALLETNNDQDPFIRHAGVSALVGIQAISELENLSSHNSNAVRIAAVVALRRLEAHQITSFLQDEDPLVVLEAARAIHDDFGIPDALPELAALLNNTPHANNEALMRRVLNANLRVGQPAHAEAVLAFASNDAQDETLQLEALDILYTWTSPPPFDRVERRYRKLAEKDEGIMTDLLKAGSSELLQSQKSAVLEKAYWVLNRYDVSLDPKDLEQTLSDGSKTAAERLQALSLLLQERRHAKKAFRTAFESQDAQLRMGAVELLASKDANEALPYIEQILSADNPIAERQQVLGLLGKMDPATARNLLDERLKTLENNSAASAEQLDIFLAAKSNGSFDDRLATLSQNDGPGNDAPFEYTLEGGNPEKGASVFLLNPAAQCIRCHAINDEGSDVGPNLQGIGDRLNRTQLLESLVDPGKTLAEGFETPNGISMMPAMGNLLSPQELRDVIEYLTSL